MASSHGVARVTMLMVAERAGRIGAAEGNGRRVKFLPLAWAGMPKTSFRKNSDAILIENGFFKSLETITGLSM